MAPLKPGLWPDQCVQRTFCEGVEWWEWEMQNATMWASDERKADEEAFKRYGVPGPAYHGYGCEKDGEQMVEWCDVCHKLAKEQERVGF